MKLLVKQLVNGNGKSMTIYVDMDGVIADFFGGLEKFYNVPHWKDIQNKNKTIAELKGTDFFYQLEPFSTSKKLISFVNIVSQGDWGINSSPLRGDRDNSVYWKRRWLEKHDMMPNVHNLVFTSTKEKYAWSVLDGMPNILIDDKPENIKRWQDKGGIGIRYQANQDDLKEYLFVEIKDALGGGPVDG